MTLRLKTDKKELYGEYREYTLWEQCKIFMRAFFCDKDIDVDEVCLKSHEFESFFRSKGSDEVCPKVLQAVMYFQSIGKPITVQQLKTDLKTLQQNGESMCLLDFLMLYYKKDFDALFDNDVDGNPDLLKKLQDQKAKVDEIENKIKQWTAQIDELSTMKGAKIFEAKRKIGEIQDQYLQPLGRELDMAWALVEDVQDEVDEEGSQLDHLLMDKGLHEKYPKLFEIL